jgi:hypothetical protein
MTETVYADGGDSARRHRRLWAPLNYCLRSHRSGSRWRAWRCGNRRRVIRMTFISQCKIAINNALVAAFAWIVAIAFIISVEIIGFIVDRPVRR